MKPYPKIFLVVQIFTHANIQQTGYRIEGTEQG